jgi:hypothetical protein
MMLLRWGKVHNFTAPHCLFCQIIQMPEDISSASVTSPTRSQPPWRHYVGITRRSGDVTRKSDWGLNSSARHMSLLPFFCILCNSVQGKSHGLCISNLWRVLVVSCDQSWKFRSNGVYFQEHRIHIPRFKWSSEVFERRSIDLLKPPLLPATKSRLWQSIFQNFLGNQIQIPVVLLSCSWFLTFQPGTKIMNLQLSLWRGVANANRD